MFGWRETTLGDVVTLQRGHDLPTPDRRPGNIPILGSFGVTGSHDTARATGPGVTVGRSGASIGVVSFSAVDYWPLNTALYVIDFHGNHERFVYYFLKSIDFSRFNSGSAQPSLNRNFIHPMPVVIPSPQEQLVIAELLGSLDDKIELNRRMNRTLEQMAAAIFKAWFVDFEPIRAKADGAKSFPSMPQKVFDALPTEFTDSPLGPIPKGWNCERLGDLADLSWGDTNTTKKSYTDDGFTAYSAKGPDGLLPYHDFDRTGVVVSAIGANSGVTWLARGKWSCIKNTIRYWSTSKTVSTEYLYHATSNPSIWPMRGSAQPFISQSEARALQVLSPGDSLGITFGRSVEEYYELAFANRRQNATLASIRDSLLPKLLSGEIRVGEAERIAEEVA